MNGKRLVKARWKDAHASSISAYAEHEIPHASLIIETVGWLLREDEAGVSLANEWCADATYRGVTFIPKGMLDGPLIDLIKPRKPRVRKVTHEEVPREVEVSRS